MELTVKGIHLLARLSRDRRLYAECKGADLDALQELGLLQWFDARSSTTPFKEDPRPLFKLLGISGRIDFFWVETVENWRELVGPEVWARVDAIDEIEWAVNNGPSTASRASWQIRSGPRSLDCNSELSIKIAPPVSERPMRVDADAEPSRSPPRLPYRRRQGHAFIAAKAP